MKRIIILSLLISTAGYADMKINITPVRNFSLNKYLGKWYEIARYDHVFERGLSKVTAEYALRKDGKVSVVNKGYLEKNGKWKTAEGKAYMAGGLNEGYLKVSFFGPFYADYIIFELDENFQYALVGSSNDKYLWVLSREPKIEQKLMDSLLLKLKEKNYDPSKLIFVDQK